MNWKRTIGALMMLSLGLGLVLGPGCATSRPNQTVSLVNAGMDPVTMLLSHPEFEAAASAAPGWTETALKTVADLKNGR